MNSLKVLVALTCLMGVGCQIGETAESSSGSDRFSLKSKDLTTPRTRTVTYTEIRKDGINRVVVSDGSGDIRIWGSLGTSSFC